MATPCLDPKFEIAIRGTVFPVMILSNLQLNDFVLVDIAEGDLSHEIQRHLAERPMCFVGVAAVSREGVPRTALDIPLDKSETDLLASAYLAHLDSCLSAMSGAPLPQANA